MREKEETREYLPSVKDACDKEGDGHTHTHMRETERKVEMHANKEERERRGGGEQGGDDETRGPHSQARERAVASLAALAAQA